MADVLILHEDATVANPGHPGAWEPGMIVDVFEDGRLGPGTDQHPRFIVVRIPGATVETVRDLIDQVLDVTDPENPVMTKKRRWKLTFSSLPGPVQAKITADREVNLADYGIGEAELRAALERFD